MNKRQKKKLWSKIKTQEKQWNENGIMFLGEGITLGYGWIYDKNKNPVKLV